MAKKSNTLMARLILAGLAATTSLTVTKAHDVTELTSFSSSVGANQSNQRYYTTGGPIDATLADEQGIVKMLKNEGKISSEASAYETHEAYEAYMKEIAKQNDVTLSKEERELQAKQSKSLLPAFNSRRSDEVTKLNVLAIMVEYSDYKHGQIQPDETTLYYDDYSKEHYQNMLFGDDGYTGPNGENFISMKQYYEEQSGGTLIINGTVTD